MDVPYPSSGYVEQDGIKIPPTPKAILSFKVWGATQNVTVEVQIVNPSTGRLDLIDSFDPEGKVQHGGVPTHHVYDLTAYSGRTIGLRITAAGVTIREAS